MSINLTEAVRLIRSAVPTSRHAQMLFDMVVARLGDRAVVESAGGETQFSIYLREGSGSDAIIPWPLLRLGTRGRLSTVVMVSAPPGTPDEPPPRPGEAPKLRGLGPGEILLFDGPDRVTVTYGKDGRWMETSRSADPDVHADVVPVLSRGSAQATELLAEYMTGIDLARHGPGRVLLPAPMPGGTDSAWRSGLYAMRDALFDDRIPPDARWVVADGFAGTSLAWGATRKEALTAWGIEIEREQPKPDIPEQPTQKKPDRLERKQEASGAYVISGRLSGPSADVPWPEFIPENTPAVVLPLEPCPHPTIAWAPRVRLLGGHGGTSHALLHRTLDGCTLIGEQLAEILDLDAIEETLDSADATSPLLPAERTDWPKHLPSLNSRTVTYEFFDVQTHDPIAPRIGGVRQSHGFVTRELDGDQLQSKALRQHWIDT